MAEPALEQAHQSDHRRLRDEAAEAARRGGAELRRLAGTDVGSRFKSSNRDFVTAADLASETAILAFIEAQHPDHSWQSEEAGVKIQDSPYRWVIDPLDGTSNYAHGYPHVCVSVAVLMDERAVAGAIYDPFRDECFVAALGDGAFLNDRQLSVSAIESLDRALVSTGFPYEPPEQRSKVADLTARAIERVQMLRRSGSAALDLAYVAAGRSEAHWEFGLNLHDVAAGLLLVHEAGGEGWEMRYGDWPTGHLATNNDHIRQSIVSLINTHFGAIRLQRSALLDGAP